MPLPDVYDYTELGALAPDPDDCPECGRLTCRDCDQPDGPQGAEARIDAELRGDNW